MEAGVRKEKYPVKRCKCGREFTVVQGYSESDQTCGICLARRAREHSETTSVPSLEEQTSSTEGVTGA
jgi:hypothetical protein